MFYTEKFTTNTASLELNPPPLPGHRCENITFASGNNKLVEVRDIWDKVIRCGK